MAEHPGPLASARLVTRLARRNVRRRPGQAALLLAALCLATTSLGLALSVRETSDGAWERLSDATDGFHVYVKSFHEPGTADRSEAAQALDELAAAPGVVAHGGPWSTFLMDGEVGGAAIELRVQVRAGAPAAVNQPHVTAGRWLGGGDGDDGVVLEDGLASTLRVEPGDSVTLGGQRFPVAGTAMTVSTQRYPLEQPALVWAPESAAAQLRRAADGEHRWLELRLSDPERAASFVAAADRTAGDPGWELHSWQERRDEEEAGSNLTALADGLLVAGVLLAGLSVVTAAVLVAGRMDAQVRQVAMLKAVGVTPGQVACVLLAEYLAAAAVATAVGMAASTALSPWLARSVLTLYGGPQAPPVTLARTGIVAAVAFGVVVLATLRPALQGARRSTLGSLAAGLRPPRRTSRLARLAGWAGALGLPLPAVLGLRAALRRPGRTAANAAGLGLAVVMVVVGLAVHDSWRRLPSTPGWASDDAAARAANQDLYDQIMTTFLVAGVLLLAFAVVNGAIVAVFAARDSARNHAIMRTVGATPRQTVTAFVVAQLAPCLLGCTLGIPLGIALFGAVGGDLAPARLPVLTYVGIVVGAPLLYAVAVSVPARLLATQPVTPLLAHE